MHLLAIAATLYFAVNFVCALLLHVHGLRQAHLPLRFLEVLVHFVLLSAMAIPVLLVTTGEALFGEGRTMLAGTQTAAQRP